MGRPFIQGGRIDQALSIASKQMCMITALAGNLTIDEDMPSHLKIDPNGSSRNLTLPSPSSADKKFLWYRIKNNADGQGEYLTVLSSDGTTVVATIAPQSETMCWSDGVSWNGNNTSQATMLGAISAQPVSGTVALKAWLTYPFFRLDFTLTLARIPVTDAGASGASGSLQLYDFVQNGVLVLASRQDYTAAAEGSALTTAAGDAAYVLGVGSVAANAGDGVLTVTEVDYAPVTGTITNSGGTGAGTKHGGVGTVVDGTTTAADVYLNWCGTAATIDANSTFDITGTITLVGVLTGDD